jgi:hypothetical protein
MLLKLAPIYLGKTVSPLIQVAELTFDNCVDLVVNPALPNKSTIQKAARVMEEDPVAGVFESPRFDQTFDKPLEALG